MATLPAPDISHGLIRRLQDDATREGAWEELLDVCSPLLHRWCRQWGIQPSDAEDVIQETLLAMVRQIKGFRYDAGGSFRAWVKTIAYRCWLRIARGWARRGEILLGDDARDMIAEDDAHGRRVADREARRDLYGMAFGRVRHRVEPATWEAFLLCTFEGLPGAEVARRLGTRPGAVYMARCRVQGLLRRELRALEAMP